MFRTFASDNPSVVAGSMWRDRQGDPENDRCFVSCVLLRVRAFEEFTEGLARPLPFRSTNFYFTEPVIQIRRVF